MPVPSSPYSASGGQSQADFFWVRLKTDKTGYDFLDPADLTSPVVLGAPTRATACVYSLTMTADTKPTPQDDGTMDIVWDNFEDSKDLNDYLLDPFAVPPASVSGNLPDWKNEKGISQTVATSNNQMLAVVVYGATTTDGIKTTAAFGSLKKTSGAHGQKSDDHSKVTIEFDGSKTEADLVIPSGCIDDVVVGTPVSVTIASGKGFKRQFIS